MNSSNPVVEPKSENQAFQEIGLCFVPTQERTESIHTVEPIQRVLFRLADVVCSLLAFFLAYSLLPTVKNVATSTILHYRALSNILSPAEHGPGIPSGFDLAWVFVVVTLAVSLTLDYTGGEKPLVTQTKWRVARMLLLAMTAALAAVATVFFALRVSPYSRIFLCSYILIFFVLTLGYRLLVRIEQRNRRQSGVAAPRVVIAGSAAGVERFLSLVAGMPQAQPMSIAGCLLADTTGASFQAKILGSIADLGELLIHHPIDQVIVILPDGEASWLQAVIEHCDYFRVGVQIVPDCFLGMQLSDLKHLNRRSSLPSIQLIPEEELTTTMLLWKRTLDVVLSFIALVVLAPIMAAIAVAIKITTPRLPVFYRWNVVGYRGRRFTGYKFTTMVADADDRKAELSQQNEMSGPVFKIRNDPRVTPLGKFLRKYSLNELPQFWSVLTGDMSLVGPRPAGPHELIRYEMWHKRKLSVQPGITCFWQVRGRNAVSNFDDWVRMDLEYIQKRSLWTDMTILVQTVSTVLRGTGC